MTDAKSKILVIEDDTDLAEMLNAYFSMEGYEVFTVNWGEDGVRSARTMHPDLVILDIRLPDIDGYEVARRLRADRRSADVPIVFLTEKSDRADRLQALELGADDFITKPFDVQELRLRVRNAITRMHQAAYSNPITGLPDGAAVDDNLNEAIDSEGVSVLMLTISNLDGFRETYGFVAADDVVRAVSLMTTTMLQEFGDSSSFFGHITPTDLVLVAPTASISTLTEQLRPRLEQAMPFFYPLNDRERAAGREDRLRARVKELPLHRGAYSDLDQIKAELMKLRK